MTDIAMTLHGAKRARERSIPELARYLLWEFGARRRSGKGTESFYFDKKAFRRVEAFLGPWRLAKMEQLQKVYMVVSDDGAIITIAYRE